MRRLGKISAIAAVTGVIGSAGVIPASALDVYVGHRHHHDYYDYYGGGRTWNGCRPGWTVQGGVCRPYQGPVGGPHFGQWYGYR
jgi:hypothetical protein